MFRNKFVRNKSKIIIAQVPCKFGVLMIHMRAIMTKPLSHLISLSIMDIFQMLSLLFAVDRAIVKIVSKEFSG